MRNPVIAATLLGSAILVACGEPRAVTPAPEPFGRTIETINEEPAPLTEDVNPVFETRGGTTGDTSQDRIEDFDRTYDEFGNEETRPETP